MEKDLSFKSQIEVKFSTTLPSEFKVPESSFTIPSSYDPSHLNDLIKKLLRNTNTSKHFAFFIQNVSLNSTISEFIHSNKDILDSYTAESVLEITYSFQLDEPKNVNTIKEDEWIRRIVPRQIQIYDKAVQSYCVGLFNSEITVYNKDSERLMKIEKENKDEDYCQLLHDLIYFNHNGENVLISCSRSDDCNLKLYHLNLETATSKLVSSSSKFGNEYFNCLSLNPVDFSYFSAGDTEGNVRIFKVPEADTKSLTKTKKRKTEVQETKCETVLDRCHPNEIKTLKWINNQQLLTSSDDFVVNLWNIQTKTNYMNFKTNYKTTTCVCPMTSEAFLTGQDDGVIKFWDSRVGSRALGTFSPPSGKISNYVADLCTNAELDPQKFISVGYDSYLRIWDMRSNKKAIHEIKTDSEKNYSVCFNSREYLMTGGDNSSINIYSI